MRPVIRGFRLAPSRRARSMAPTARARRGFSIVEAIVAIVMLAAGVLALVSSSAVVLKEMTTGSRNTIAASVATQRLERLRSFDQCASITAGSAATAGMREWWTATAVSGTGGQPSRHIAYKLEYNTGRRLDTLEVVTSIPCTT